MELEYITTKIHSKETAGMVDGPGLRYVLFMQGCPLRCKFCHNPDSWKMDDGKLVNVSEIFKEIISYKSFMKFSNGGVTASGGEPLLHKKFLATLFHLLKDEGIHTAIDTSGYTMIDDELNSLLDYTDLVLLDVKHLKSNKHAELTKVTNIRTLELLDHLQSRKINTWVRWVVLPGFNDSLEYAEEFASFISKYNNVELVELLPYHEVGKYKWEEMKMKYELDDVSPPTAESMQNIEDILTKHKIKVLRAK